MSITALLRVGALAGTIPLTLALPAHAQSNDLGTITGPSVFHISGDLGPRPATESWTFRVAADVVLDLSSLVFTPLNADGPWLDTLSTMMFDWRGHVLSGAFGTPETVGSPTPGRQVRLDAFPLEAGRDYRFRVWAPYPDDPDTLLSGHYEGTLTFGRVAAPVPEASTLAMLLAGLALLSPLTRRRG